MEMKNENQIACELKIHLVQSYEKVKIINIKIG